MKSGLLPVCYEAMMVGEIAYSEYTGEGPGDAANVQQALSSNAKVRCSRLFMRLVTLMQLYFELVVLHYGMIVC